MATDRDNALADLPRKVFVDKQLLVERIMQLWNKEADPRNVLGSLLFALGCGEFDVELRYVEE
jgi:hypothetical protein